MSFVVLDEADRMFSLGFEPQVIYTSVVSEFTGHDTVIIGEVPVEPLSSRSPDALVQCDTEEENIKADSRCVDRPCPCGRRQTWRGITS